MKIKERRKRKRKEKYIKKEKGRKLGVIIEGHGTKGEKRREGGRGNGRCKGAEKRMIRRACER